jgi:uncharacterized protein (DUF362 family)/NAD-dependent dihydropyrimidine dehydrogenase PreA subunit
VGAKVLIREAAYPVEDAVVGDLLDEFAPSLDGRTVLVKPNCLMAAEPEQAVTTHPSLVRSLVASLRRRGAKVMVGDNPGARGYGAGEHCFRATGLLDAAGDAFVDLGRNTVRVGIRSEFVDEVVVSRHVLDADFVISVPKLKTHCLTLLTGAVKNMYGILAGGEKVKLHSLARGRKDFAAALVDVYSLRPPDLALTDAVVAMEGNGPSHGSPRAVGRILASDDPVAADAAAARIMGVEPGRIDHLAIAAARGLGSLEKIVFDGNVSPVDGFSLPSMFRLGLMTFLSNRLVFNLLRRSRIQVEKGECVGCDECRQACPAGAMVESGGHYTVRQELCHQCFCCYELCPEGAIKVRGALGALLEKREKV